jgi:arabinofuranosyltransferase
MRVGGDYMSGRFLSPAFFLGCAVLVRYVRLSGRWAAVGTVAVLALGLIALRPSLTTTSDFWVGKQYPESMGVVDERAFFYKSTGVLRWRRGLRWPDFAWTDTGDAFRRAKLKAVPVLVAGTIPYRAGPAVYILDIGALGDALLARLPPQPGKNKPGHYYRTVPSGYMETVTTGENRLRDPKIAEYYEHLRAVIRGPLWSWARMREIFALNTGRYDALLPKEDKDAKRIDQQQ